MKILSVNDYFPSNPPQPPDRVVPGLVLVGNYPLYLDWDDNYSGLSNIVLPFSGLIELGKTSHILKECQRISYNSLLFQGETAADQMIRSPVIPCPFTVRRKRVQKYVLSVCVLLDPEGIEYVLSPIGGLLFLVYLHVSSLKYILIFLKVADIVPRDNL